MIRVLHVVTTMDRGGIETMLMNYYRKVDKSKIQFDFLKHVDYTCDYEEEAIALGSRVYTMTRLNPFSGVYRQEIDNFFKEHTEYKIVHAHLDCLSSLPLLYAKKNNVQFRIAHAHNTNQDHNLKYFLKMYYRHKIPYEANILFACGEDAGKWMYGEKEFTVLHNAIDSKQFEYNDTTRNTIRQKWNLNDEFTVGHVGRFFEQKNHKKLIDIFEAVVSKEPRSKLLLVGTGPLEDNIREYVKLKNLQNNVIFCGLQQEVNKMLCAMDVFVLPSLYEGLPVTLIEAQASGIKCVVSNTITKEAKISENVVYIPLDGEDNYWADKILTVGKNYKRLDMSEAIKSHQYDIDKNSDGLQEYYLHLVG